MVIILIDEGDTYPSCLLFTQSLAHLSNTKSPASPSFFLLLQAHILPCKYLLLLHIPQAKFSKAMPISTLLQARYTTPPSSLRLAARSHLASLVSLFVKPTVGQASLSFQSFVLSLPFDDMAKQSFFPSENTISAIHSRPCCAWLLDSYIYIHTHHEILWS